MVTLFTMLSTAVSEKKMMPSENLMSQYAEPKCQFDVSENETVKVVDDVTTTVQEYSLPAESRMSEVMVNPVKSGGDPVLAV